MDIVRFLKPKYVLMENVVDILRFDNGSLGRYALSRLVHMNYQARLGIVAAGCYGVPQFRLRVFLWGAHPDEVCFIIWYEVNLMNVESNTNTSLSFKNIFESICLC